MEPEQPNTLITTAKTTFLSDDIPYRPFFRPILQERSIDDSFFTEGNLEREIIAKQFKLPQKELDFLRADLRSNGKLFPCNIEGCHAQLPSVIAFETHYLSVHSNRCAKCHASYPSSRLLEIHISERHDPIFKALSQNQKMYRCLVDGCGRKFWGEKQRRLHLVDLHKYPRDFDFNYKRKKNNITNQVKLSTAAESTKNQNKMHTTTTEKENEKREMETTVSSSPLLDNQPKSSATVSMEAELCSMESLSLKPAEEHVSTSGTRFAAAKIPENFSFGRRRGNPFSHNLPLSPTKSAVTESSSPNRSRGSGGHRGGRGRGSKQTRENSSGQKSTIEPMKAEGTGSDASEQSSAPMYSDQTTTPSHAASVVVSVVPSTSAKT